MITHSDFVINGRKISTKEKEIGFEEFCSLKKCVFVNYLKNWWMPKDVPGPDFKAQPNVYGYFHKKLFLCMPRHFGILFSVKVAKNPLNQRDSIE